MVGIYAVSTAIFGLVGAAHLFRKHSLACFPAWFLAASVLFINAAFTANWFAQPALQSSNSAAMVSSTGILVATLFALLGHTAGASLRKSTLVRERTYPPAQELPVAVSNRSLIWVTIAILGPAWLYFALLGSVPLFDGIAAIRSEGLGGLGELQAARLARDPYASANASRVPLQGLLEIFRNFGAPLVFAYALAQYRLVSPDRRRVIVMTLAVVTCLAAGQRWPLMRVLVAAIMVLALTSSGLNGKRVVRIVGVGAAAGIAISSMQARTTETLGSAVQALSFGAQNLTERILLAQAQIPIASYALDPSPFEDLRGASYLQSLRSYLPGPGASFPVDFYKAVTGDTRGHTSPPDFYTEAFLNFGLAGVVVMTAGWMLVIAAFDLRPRPRTAEDVALAVGPGCFLAFSASTGAVFTLAALIPLSVAIAIFKRGTASREPVDRTRAIAGGKS